MLSILNLKTTTAAVALAAATCFASSETASAGSPFGLYSPGFSIQIGSPYSSRYGGYGADLRRGYGPGYGVPGYGIPGRGLDYSFSRGSRYNSYRAPSYYPSARSSYYGGYGLPSSRYGRSCR